MRIEFKFFRIYEYHQTARTELIKRFMKTFKKEALLKNR
jgi:hypothetical protein